MSDTHRPGVVIAGSLLSGPPASSTSTLIDGSALKRWAITHPADPAPTTTKSKVEPAGVCAAVLEGRTAAEIPMVLMKSRRFISAFQGFRSSKVLGSRAKHRGSQVIDKPGHSCKRALAANEGCQFEQAGTDHAAGERQPGAVNQRPCLDAARLCQRA